MYDKMNLFELFDELGILYNRNTDGMFRDDEQCALSGVIDCNGDGDDYFMIGEITGNELKILVE